MAEWFDTKEKCPKLEGWREVGGLNWRIYTRIPSDPQWPVDGICLREAIAKHENFVFKVRRTGSSDFALEVRRKDEAEWHWQTSISEENHDWIDDILKAAIEWLKAAGYL